MSDRRPRFSADIVKVLGMAQVGMTVEAVDMIEARARLLVETERDACRKIAQSMADAHLAEGNIGQALGCRAVAETIGKRGDL